MSFLAGPEAGASFQAKALGRFPRPALVAERSACGNRDDEQLEITSRAGCVNPTPALVSEYPRKTRLCVFFSVTIRWVAFRARNTQTKTVSEHQEYLLSNARENSVETRHYF